MTKRILIDGSHPEDVRIAIENKGKLEEFDFEHASRRPIKGNIYLGKITRVEPSLQAAFVEYGGNRQGFLPFSEVHYDYFQIPVADKEKLIAELEAEIANEPEEDDDDLYSAEDSDHFDDLDDDDDEEEEEEETPAQAMAKKDETPTLAVDVKEDKPAPKKRAARKPVAKKTDEKEEKPAPKKRAVRKPAAKKTADKAEPAAKDAQEASSVAAPEAAPEQAEEKPKRTRRRSSVKKNDPSPDADSAKTEETTAEDSHTSDEDDKQERRGRRGRGRRGGRNRRTPVEGAEDTTPDEHSHRENIGLNDDSEAPLSDDQDERVEAEMARKKRARFYRQYNIQEVLKRGQLVLVQVVKEERGNKGAAITTYISIPGRFCVFMPNTERAGGVSRRIQDGRERKRLKHAIRAMDVPKQSSIIVRTAGVGKSDEELAEDYNYLSTLWQTTTQNAVNSTAPALVMEEGDIIRRTLRDLFRKDITEVQVEGKEAHDTAKEFVQMLAPDSLNRLKKYTDSEPLFSRYNVESQLDTLYESEARLPSGGALVINPTEALVAIDVNSGKSTGERSIEATALKTNIEAAQEVARQLRLRDLAGLIVIDFIDMREMRNKRTVEKALKDALKSDRAKIQVGRISSFGLLEMSRQRLRSSILESSSQTCRVCSGTGLMRSDESTALYLLRQIETEAANRNSEKITIHVAAEAALYLLNHKRKELDTIEEKFEVEVEICLDYGLQGVESTIEQTGKQQRRRRGGSAGAGGGRNKQGDGAQQPERSNQKRDNRNQPAPAEEKPKDVKPSEPEPVKKESTAPASTTQYSPEADQAEKPSRRRVRRSERRKQPEEAGKSPANPEANRATAPESTDNSPASESSTKKPRRSSRKPAPANQNRGQKSPEDLPGTEKTAGLKAEGIDMDELPEDSKLRTIWRKITT